MSLRWLKNHVASLLDKRVDVANRPDHQGARRAVDPDVVSETVRYPRGVVTLEHRSALTVEMHGGFVDVQFVEHRCERISSPKLLSGHRISAVHVYEKVRIVGEQTHLTSSVAPIGTVRVGVDQFADGKSVRRLSRGQVGVATAAGLPCCHAPSLAFDVVAVDVLRNNLSGPSV